MDSPTPPKDSALRNIIDKLAEFVARNGPEFETITKAKQQGNPKFEFLYGGEFYQYYQWRVSTEQAILKHQGSISQAQSSQQPPQMQQPQQQQSLLQPTNSASGANSNNIQTQMWNNGQAQPNPPSPNPLAAQIEALNVQQTALRDQILQSEQNLSAQHGVLLQQQQSQIDDAILKAQHENLMKQAEASNIRLTEFEDILQPIIDSCTKDSISTGKNWILQHTTDPSKCNVILQYLLKKALVNGAQFSQKLHLIYLVNDVLHHCVRKHADDLKNNLENIVIPMFCSSQIIANAEQKAKLCKLLSLWESKANFFDACVISKLRSPNSSMQEYKTNLMNTYAIALAPITQATKATFDNYKQQHQAFVLHATQKIALLETQKQALIEQQNKIVSQIPPLMPPDNQSLNNPTFRNNDSSNAILHSAQNNSINRNDRPSAPPPLMSQTVAVPLMSIQTVKPTFTNNNINNDNLSSFQNPEPPSSLFNQGGTPDNISSFGQPPPSFLIPDLSKPPPGFSLPTPEVPPLEEVKPTSPYYELPAGLMVPLIRLEDYNYRSLNADDLRLPPPSAPSARLVGAIEAFYSLPCHDRPRDAEGWEKLGLYEYYKVKKAAKKTKEEQIAQGLRERSKSPSPILIEPPKSTKPNKRRYRSKSRSRSRSRSPENSRESRDSRKSRRSHRWSRSPKKQSSPVHSKRNNSPKRDRERDRDRDRDRNKDRDSSMSPPPSFFGGNYPKASAECIEEGNKGHQMLMKMGWAGSGTGLGTHGQGIDAPIPSGEVRDRQDQFKGVGMNLNDPYENFRKNKGAAFIHRMRSRDNDRKSKNVSPEP